MKDFSEIKGHFAVRRAIEVAIAGSHNVVIVGGPGMGKTMFLETALTLNPECLLADELLPPKILLDESAPVIMAERPCECGYYLSDEHECTCTAEQILHHAERVKTIRSSIGLFAYLGKIRFDEIMDNRQSESTKTILDRINKSKSIAVSDRINADASRLLRAAFTQLRLSAGEVFRAIDVSKTVAALAEETEVGAAHIAEAIQYRARKPYG